MNIQLHPEIFTFIKIPDGIVDIRNFQTTEIVANECGCPFYALRSGRLDIWGQRVRMKEEYKQNNIADIQAVVPGRLSDV